MQLTSQALVRQMAYRDTTEKWQLDGFVCLKQ